MILQIWFSLISGNTASMASREQNFGMFDDNTDANSADNPVIRDGTGLLTSAFSPLTYLSNRFLTATSTTSCFVLSSRWWLSWHVSHIQGFWQLSQQRCGSSSGRGNPKYDIKNSHRHVSRRQYTRISSCTWERLGDKSVALTYIWPRRIGHLGHCKWSLGCTLKF